VTTLGSQSADTDIETPPKTGSGKIMRRPLRDVAQGRELGDTSTLVDRPACRDGPEETI
jgi:hypothetical protein